MTPMLTGVVATVCSSREELTTTSGSVTAAALRRELHRDRVAGDDRHRLSHRLVAESASLDELAAERDFRDPEVSRGIRRDVAAERRNPDARVRDRLAVGRVENDAADRAARLLRREDRRCARAQRYRAAQHDVPA